MGGIALAAAQQVIPRGDTHYDPNQDPKDEPHHHPHQHPEFGPEQAEEHHVSMWIYLIKMAFPVPLGLLVLLMIPVPASLRNTIDGLVAAVLSKTLLVKVPMVGRSILTMVITISGCILCYELYETSYLKTREGAALSYKEKKDLRMIRWRAERNFWIVFMAFTLWVMLHRFISKMKENRRLEKELKALQQQLGNTTNLSGQSTSTRRSQAPEEQEASTNEAKLD